MRRYDIFGIVALTIVLVSALSLPYAFAAVRPPRGQTPNGKSYVVRRMQYLYAVSNPSGDCRSLGLIQMVGMVVIGNQNLYVYLHSSNPNNDYSVSVSYLTANGQCDTATQNVWLGSISLNGVGAGGFTQSLTTLSGHNVMVVVRDGQGNAVYATPPISL